MRRAFTLVEILVATALTLVIMGVTVTLFADISGRISGSRAIIETSDRLRSCRERLAMDLAGITAQTLPPLHPEANMGYVEYVEGTETDVARLAVIARVIGTGNAAAATPVLDTDNTIGDVNDVLMFTTRSISNPFIGRWIYQPPGFPPPPVVETVTQSQVAEVAWFMRGTTLYRRVLLVVPGTAVETMTGFYGRNDISVRTMGGTHDPDEIPMALATSDPDGILVPNSLGDLTKRENRFAHQPKTTTDSTLFGFPHSAAQWGQLGLPTIRECSFPDTTTAGPVDKGWPFPWLPPTGTAPYGTFPIFPRHPTATTYTTPIAPIAQTANNNLPVYVDLWSAPFRTTEGIAIWDGFNPVTSTLSNYDGPRLAEDIILTNVISFDVKAWDAEALILAKNGPDGTPDTVDDIVYAPGDPQYGTVLAEHLGAATPTPPSDVPSVVGTGAFVDLNYYSADPALSNFSGPGDITSLTATYDTWSSHYESDGIDQDQDGTADEATNGVDDDMANGIDDDLEREAPPPYSTPLRGIQVKIRIFEPDSRQIREVTVTQQFLPE